jgi:hypothetical protein
MVTLWVAALPLPCLAQHAMNDAAEEPPAPPSPQALALARTLVAKSSNDDVAALSFLYPPMARLMMRANLLDPDRVMIVTREAMLPVLRKHKAEIDAFQAETYASILTVDDMKAAITFYDTPAGADYVRSWAPVLKLNRAGIDKLIDTLKPEIDAEAKVVMKKHGWTKG